MARQWRFGLLAGLLALTACGEDEQRGVEGRFTLVVSESRDTCDNQTNSFGSEITITRDGDDVVVTFGQDAILTGTIDENGEILAQGVVEDQGGGRTTVLAVRILVRRTRLESTGRQTFNGTFPGVPGTCLQEFSISGQRANVVPTLFTSPTFIDESVSGR